MVFSSPEVNDSLRYWACKVVIAISYMLGVLEFPWFGLPTLSFFAEMPTIEHVEHAKMCNLLLPAPDQLLCHLQRHKQQTILFVMSHKQRSNNLAQETRQLVQPAKGASV